MTAILYVLRNGGEWSCLPKNLGAKSTMHDRFQEWNRAGVFENTWTAALELLQYLEALDLEWQSTNGAMVKALLDGEKTGCNPTDLGKLGVKRSLHVDGNGLPLGLALAGANRHDMKLLRETLDAIQVILPEPSAELSQNICLDAGYDI